MKKLASWKKSNPGTVKVVLVVLVIAVVGFIIWQRQHHAAQVQNHNAEKATGTGSTAHPSSTETATPGAEPVKGGSFDIEAFYNNLQDDMTLEKTTELASQPPDDCVGTDSEPPSQTCIWYSGEKTVTVNFGQTNTLKSKIKSGF